MRKLGLLHFYIRQVPGDPLQYSVELIGSPVVVEPIKIRSPTLRRPPLVNSLPELGVEENLFSRSDGTNWWYVLWLEIEQRLDQPGSPRCDFLAGNGVSVDDDVELILSRSRDFKPNHSPVIEASLNLARLGGLSLQPNGIWVTET